MLPAIRNTPHMPFHAPVSNPAEPHQAARRPVTPVRLKDSRLALLPPELTVAIFKYLKPGELAKTVDLTCKRFYVSAKSAYKSHYGSYVPHRQLDVPPNWKKMAAEKYEVLDNLEEIYHQIGYRRRPDDGLSHSQTLTHTLLQNHYYKNTRLIATISEKMAIILQESPDYKTPAWHEAMATLMMAQGRHIDALTAYKAFLRAGKTLPDHTWLTAGRFGWPHPIALPQNPPPLILKRAVSGAAIAGDVAVMHMLAKADAPLDFTDEENIFFSPVTTAAKRGHVALMKYLHKHGINLARTRRSRSVERKILRTKTPLLLATESGRTSVVSFLLSIGVDCHRASDTDKNHTPLEHALRFGLENILKIFIKYAPQFANGPSADGHRLVMQIFDTHEPSYDRSRARTIALLVDAGCLEVNAWDADDGCTLAHRAAQAGDLAALKTLWQLGADLTASDFAGWTPGELAASWEHREVITWLRTQIPAATFYGGNDKHTLAHNIIRTQRHIRIKNLLTAHNMHFFAGATIETKAADASKQWRALDMENKLAKVWGRHFSARTLQRWHEKVFKTPLGPLTLKFFELASESTRVPPENIGAPKGDELSESLVQHLLCKLYPPYWQVSSFGTKYLCHAVATGRMHRTHLQTVYVFYKSRLGCRIAAGLKAAYEEEMRVQSSSLDRLAAERAIWNNHRN